MATLMRNALGRYKNQYTEPNYTEKERDADYKNNGQAELL